MSSQTSLLHPIAQNYVDDMLRQGVASLSRVNSERIKAYNSQHSDSDNEGAKVYCK